MVVSMTGNSDTGVFPGITPVQNGFDITVSTGPAAGNNVSSRPSAQVPNDAVHSWDFGSGEIYEIEPREPVGGARPAMVIRSGLTVDASASSAALQIGDTVVAQLVGIPRLGIADGSQKAVVRYVGADLIIAEDVRLSTLARQNGGFNTPLTMTDMQSIPTMPG